MLPHWSFDCGKRWSDDEIMVGVAQFMRPAFQSLAIIWLVDGLHLERISKEKTMTCSSLMGSVSGFNSYRGKQGSISGLYF